MKIGRYLYAALTGDSAVSALVGNRVYPVFMPQNAAYPCIVYMVRNAPHDPTKTGPGYLDKAVVTLHIWMEAREGQNAYDTLDDIDAAVRDVLDYAQNAAGGITVEHAQYSGSVDGRDEAMMTYLREMEYSIIHRK